MLRPHVPGDEGSGHQFPDMIPCHLHPPRIDTPPPLGKADLHLLRVRYLSSVTLPQSVRDLLDALAAPSPHPDSAIDAEFDDLRELVKEAPLTGESRRFALNWVISAQQYWSKGEHAPARLQVETVCRKFAEEIAALCQDQEFLELEPFQGIWQPVETVLGGRSLTGLKHRHAVVVGNTYFVYQAYVVDRWGTFQIDAGHSTRRIDTLPVLGDRAGGRVRGNYMMMGDEALQLQFTPDRGPEWQTLDVHMGAC